MNAKLHAVLLLPAFLICFVFSMSATNTQAQTITPDLDMGEPLPEWQPPLATGIENQIVIHTAVGETAAFPRSEAPTLSRATTTASAPAKASLRPMQPTTPDDFSTLTLIPDTDIWPWQVLVRLAQTYPSGATTSCSGTLIDAKHVLTAAHCVYTFTASRCTGGASSCWASNIEVTPGYDNGAAPFGTANSEYLFSWTAWTIDHNYDYDMALIRLDRPVGALTGWFGFGYDNTDSFFTNASNLFRSTGYPGSPFSNTQFQYTWTGLFDTVQTHILYHNDLSYGGQSGSGTYLNSNQIVYGVLSHGHDSVPDTGHTRITSDKYNDIMYQINDMDTPIGTDLIPLDVNLSPSTIVSGQSLTTLNYLTHNYSLSDWNTCMNIRVYLSTNDTISTSDELLQTHQFCEIIGSKGSMRINVSVPPQIPYGRSGNYWIGIILEDGSVTNPNNATSGWDAAAITVRATDNYEPDNSSGQAKTIANGSPQTHSILPIGESDWVKFTLTQSSAVTLETSGPSGDTELWLYNSSVSQINYDDDGGSGTFSRLAYNCTGTPLAAGTYYARVAEFNNNEEIASYSLSYNASTCSSGSDMYEPDNSAAAANTLLSGLAQTHSIVPATDVDWLRFTVSSPAQVIIATSGASGDTRLWLYDEQLQEITFDDDSGPDFFSQIELACPEFLPAGSYYLQVDEFNNDNEIAAYNMTLTIGSGCTSNVYLPFLKR